MESTWMKDIMPGLFPHYLRIVNKPLLEYFIDFCALNKIVDIRIVKSDPTSEMENYFNTGPQKGFNLSYVMGRANDSLGKVVLKNSNFCSDTDLLIINGLFFLNYHKDKIDPSVLERTEPASMYGGAKEDIYFIPKNRKFSEIDFANSQRFFPDLDITKLESVQDYYNLSMRILKENQDDYFLPGYNNKPGEFIGRNVTFNSHRSVFKKPFMIGNDVQFYEDCHILENSIIGNHVIIDAHSTTKDCIIYDQTYLGSCLEIEKKIIYRNHLIDGISGEYINIIDQFFVSKINKILENELFKFTQKILALLGLIIGFIPFIIGMLLKPLSKIMFDKTEYFHDINGNTITMKRAYVEKPNIISHWFFRFALDKYLLLGKVFSGKLALVGNYPLISNSYGKLIWEQLDNYHPAVISYPEAQIANVFDNNFILHEIYYNHHSSLGLIFKIIYIFCLNRMFSIREYFENGFFSKKGL
jgi:hypothetical protein